MAYVNNPQQRNRLELIKIITNGIGAVLGTCVMGALIAWLGINAITGCGEVTRTMDGTYLKGECVLVPWVDAEIYDHYVG
jgi:hypothetical protein